MTVFKDKTDLYNIYVQNKTSYNFKMSVTCTDMFVVKYFFFNVVMNHSPKIHRRKNQFKVIA